MKSYLALSMAHAVATGEPWLGRPTKQGRVLYVDGENPLAEISKRLRGFGTDDQLTICTWDDPEFPQGLNDANLRHDSRLYSLIIIDTLRRQMGDLKENSSDDMAQMTKQLRGLTKYEATVLVLHHASKNSEKQEYRGSTELGGGVDINLSLTMKETNGRTMLTLSTLGHGKNRFGPKDQFQIGVREGTIVPMFETLTERSDDPGRGTKSGKQENEQAFLELASVIEELRETLRRNPIQSEIWNYPRAKKLGSKNTIIGLLEKGDGTHWRTEQTSKGKRISYAPLVMGGTGASCTF